jgi:hypothetical protein
MEEYKTMEKKYPANDFVGGQTSILIEKDPDLCPICHRNISPRYLEAHRLIVDGVFDIEVLYRCTNAKCQSCFVAYYQREGQKSQLEYYVFRETKPRTFINQAFSKQIQNVSQNFVKIYNQSLAAESLGLTEINGIGLRKSIEFLVKDFAIHLSPDKQEEIKKAKLGGTIKTYIKDEAVKSMATLATWLGNDETHYVRKWENKDIEDLKRLIRLTVNAIENALLMEEYEKEMNPDGKS